MAMAPSISSSFPRRPPPSLAPTTTFSSFSTWSPARHAPRRRRRRRRAPTAASSLHLGLEDIAELARNKVLIAATVAGAIGQLSKPFTSGRDARGVDFIRVAVRSGGMPSTHSAAVVAVTTSLALERGFADSVFGMSVVFAAIVMYDAQFELEGGGLCCAAWSLPEEYLSGNLKGFGLFLCGVRREVGNHARRINKLWILREQKAQNEEDDALPTNRKMAAELVSVTDNMTSSQCSNAVPYSQRSPGMLRSKALRSSEPELTELTELKQVHTEEFNQLSESVGHTELQVAVGALLGFVVSLAVYATL